MPQKRYAPSGIGEGYRKAGPYMGLGVEFAASVILCFVLGRWIDGELDTAPIGALIGFLSGTTAAIINLIRSVNRLHERAQERERESRDEGE